MSTDWTYKPRDWNLVCDICGFKIKASQSRKRWDGFVVCEQDWEARHPMDFIKTPIDKISVPFSRPRPPDIFVSDGSNNNQTINGAPINSTEIN